MHLCYAVTSSGRDNYAHLAYISATAARLVHPSIRLTVCVDEITQEDLRQCRSPLFDAVDEVVCVQTGHREAKLRSRALKTQARLHVKGDFLLIDADAIPIAPLDEVFALDCDVAASLDRNEPAETYKLAPWVVELYQQLGWTYDRPRFYNGGVLLFRDTPKAHEVSKGWHEHWLKTTAVGRSDDQPSLNYTIVKVQPKLAIIPPRYNLLVDGVRLQSTRNAAMVHLYAIGRTGDTGTIAEALIQKLRATGQMDLDLLKRMIDERYVWMDPYFVKAHLRAGSYFKAGKAAVVKLARKLKR